MSKKQSYFSIGSKLFWGLVLLVFVFVLLKLNPGIFKGDKIARDIIVEDSLSKINWEENLVQEDSTKYLNDTSKIVKDDYYYRTWSWNSNTGNHYDIKFKIKKSDYQKSVNNRLNSSAEYIYKKLFESDKNSLENLLEGYKEICQTRNLNSKEKLEMILTSIQSIKYTWVLDNRFKCGSLMKNKYIPPQDCKEKEDPWGCCDNVQPLGVYSPVEFVLNRAGDCDTRSLLAFTILRQLGFDVAIMGSWNESHSVLGISVNNLGPNIYLRTGNHDDAKNYYLWELTYKWDPQVHPQVQGNDWEIFYK